MLPPPRPLSLAVALACGASACTAGPTQSIQSAPSTPVETPPAPAPPSPSVAPPTVATTSPAEVAAPAPTESHGVLPYRREPLVVVSTDPAHCPADAPSPTAWPSTAVGEGFQCIRYLGNLGHWYRVVLAPAEAPKSGKKTRYRACVSEVGTRPPQYAMLLAADSGPRADFAIAVRDLPGGKAVEIVNAPVWKKGGQDEIPLTCGHLQPLPVVNVGPGEALPRWVERSTGKVLEGPP